MRIPQDLPMPAPTPSFTSAPISTGNEPGDFGPLKWLIAIFLFGILILVIFRN